MNRYNVRSNVPLSLDFLLLFVLIAATLLVIAGDATYVQKSAVVLAMIVDGFCVGWRTRDAGLPTILVDHVEDPE